MKKILLLAFLFFIFQKINAQSSSIGTGIGISSSGICTTTLTLQIKKIGAYMSFMREAPPMSTKMANDTWHRETTLGLSYEVFSDYPKMNILVGMGKTTTIQWYRSEVFPYSLHDIFIHGNSYETGINIQIYKFIGITGLISNYSQMKTMINLKYTFK